MSKGLVIEFIRESCPFPSVDEKRNLFNGWLYYQPKMCKKCRRKECSSLVISQSGQSFSHYHCDSGFSLVRFEFPDGMILCNGIIVSGLNTLCSGTIKKKNKSQKVMRSYLEAWYQFVVRLMDLTEKQSEKKSQEAIRGLHDIKTAVSLVTRNAESIVETLQGVSDTEKIENAPVPLKRLLKSVEVLHTRLQMSSIVANPEAASYGSKHPTPIYRLFDRMKRLFGETALRDGKAIRMEGSSFNQPLAFDSLDTLALALVDNAVKYCSDRGEIVIFVQDLADNGVQVSVTNTGTIIPEPARGSIFEKGFRTEEAKKQVSSGSGLGLYIAAVVAKAHGFTITYEPVVLDQKRGFAKNCFSFVIV